MPYEVRHCRSPKKHPPTHPTPATLLRLLLAVPCACVRISSGPILPTPLPIRYLTNKLPSCRTRSGSSRSAKSSTSSASSRTTPSIPAWTTGEYGHVLALARWRWPFCFACAMLKSHAFPVWMRRYHRLSVGGYIPVPASCLHACEHRRLTLGTVEHIMYRYRRIFGGDLVPVAVPSPNVLPLPQRWYILVRRTHRPQDMDKQRGIAGVIGPRANGRHGRRSLLGGSKCVGGGDAVKRSNFISPINQSQFS